MFATVAGFVDGVVMLFSHGLCHLWHEAQFNLQHLVPTMIGVSRWRNGPKCTCNLVRNTVLHGLDSTVLIGGYKAAYEMMPGVTWPDGVQQQPIHRQWILQKFIRRTFEFCDRLKPRSPEFGHMHKSSWQHKGSQADATHTPDPPTFPDTTLA